MLDGVDLSGIHNRLIVWRCHTQVEGCDDAVTYVILAVIIVVVNLVLPGYVTGLCQGWGMNAGIAGTIASVVNTLLAVIVSYPLLKFWVMPKSGSKETAKSEEAAK